VPRTRDQNVPRAPTAPKPTHGSIRAVGGAGAVFAGMSRFTVYWAQYQNNGSVWGGAEGSPASAAAIVNSQANPWFVAADSTNVYRVTRATNGVVHKATVSGANVTPLAQNQNTPQAITVDGTYVYWTTDPGNTVMHIPIAGGTPQVLWNGNGPRQIVTDANAIYWTSSGNNQIMKLAK
jgi:hypothetical protein